MNNKVNLNEAPVQTVEQDSATTNINSKAKTPSEKPIKTFKAQSISKDKIQFLEFNRKVDEKQVKKLTKLISAHNQIIRPVILINYNKALRIADGQHLYRACERLEITNKLRYLVVDREFTSDKEVIDFVTSLNSSQRRWVLSDYVEAYKGDIEKTHYSQLYNLYNKFGKEIPYKHLALVTSDKNYSSDSIMKGNYTFDSDPKDILKFCDMLLSCIKILGRINTKITSELISCYKDDIGLAADIDLEAYIKDIGFNKTELSSLSDTSAIRNMFNKINMKYVPVPNYSTINNQANHQIRY